MPENVANACTSVNRFAIPIITGFGVVSIISASYVGLNGYHTWRLADSYSQILGMLGQRGLGPVDTFHGWAEVFDMPVYQAIIAGLATITGSEPLLIVRVFDAVLFVIFIYAGARIADTLRPGSGLVLAVLLVTSPLYLNYYSTPLPDLLSMTCSIAAAMLLVSPSHESRYWHALPLIALGALIKSPVAFVFLTFYVTWLLVNRHLTMSNRGAWLRLTGVLAISLSAALAAEMVRWSITGWPFASGKLRWYFGTLNDRISPKTWIWAARHFNDACAFSWLAIVALIALAAYIVVGRSKAFRLLLPLVVGYMSGWLVFTDLYADHDYYGLPTMFMVFAAVSIAVRGIGSSMMNRDEWPTAVGVGCVLAVPFMIIYGHKATVYGVTSEGDAMRFALRDVTSFVYVSDEPGYPTPEPGGLAAKPFETISPSELRKSCTAILERAHALVVRRQNAEKLPQCRTMARESAQSFLVGPTYEIFVLGN